MPKAVKNRLRPGAERRANVLGVGISALDLGSAVHLVEQALHGKRKGYICVTGAHGVIEAQTDQAFRRILNQAYLCTPDGMPTVWMGRLMGYRHIDRVYGPDLMLNTCKMSLEFGFRHFLYGGANGTAALQISGSPGNVTSFELNVTALAASSAPITASAKLNKNL